MSRIDELIKEYCPDGVEYKQIIEIAEVSIGEFVKKDKQGDEKPYPVYNGGITNTGYYDDFNRNGAFTIISARGANAGFVNYIRGKYWAGNSCYSVKAKNEETDDKYLFYAIKNSESLLMNIQQTGSIPAVSKKQVLELEVPVPPLPVQQEIVHILDAFTSLQDELKKELEERKKQYKEYASLLFQDLDDIVSERCLGDISTSISSGKNKSRETNGLYPVYGSTGIIGYSNHFVYEKEQVLIARVGANAGYTHMATGKYDVSDNTLIVDNKEVINAKYLYHVLSNMNLNMLAKGGGQPLVTAGDIKKIRIKVPSLKAQEHIVDKLKIFDEYNNAIEHEYSLRKQQYEYYRDKFLSFDRIIK